MHRTYQRGLPLEVYLPFGLMGAAVLVAAVMQPATIPSGALWLAGVAVAGGVATTTL